MTEILNAKLSRTELCKLFDLSKGYVSKLETAGVLKANSDGTFTLHKVVRDWVEHVESRRNDQRLADEAKLRQLKIDQMEIRKKERAGELAEIGLLKDLCMEVNGWFASRLEMLPTRFTRDIKERQRLKSMIDQMRTDFVEKIHELKPQRKKHG